MGRGARVVEIGARNINGSAREVFGPVASEYYGIDLVAGAGVDAVADAETFAPPFAPDLVVCCEVFEHTDRWPEILEHVREILKPGGWLVATMATDPRAPHSASDGGSLRDSEYYQNIAPILLVDTLRACGFEQIGTETSDVRGDLYVIARAPESLTEAEVDELMS